MTLPEEADTIRFSLALSLPLRKISPYLVNNPISPLITSRLPLNLIPRPALT